MKLTPKKLIEFCEANEGHIDNAAWLLTNKLGQPSWIKDGLLRGFFQATTFKADGVPRYLVVWSMSNQNYFSIAACAQLGRAQPAENFKDCLAGLIDFARNIPGCRGLDLVTLRPGLVNSMLAANFKPVGVALELTF